ncbi:MAG: NAD(P)H-hydrate dehydratase [Opitutaceae bacterium]
MKAMAMPPVLSCAQAAEFERGLFGGDETAEWQAMRRAGTAVARGILSDFDEIGGFSEAGRVLVLVGKGHNGGDALIAAREILRRNPKAGATVVFVFGERSVRPLTRRAWMELAQEEPGRVEAAPIERAVEPEHAGLEVVIDGVFGFRFRPPLAPAAAGALRRVNAASVRLRAAVDLPSGLDEADGFRADFTYATGSVKRPVLEARNAGRVRYLDLGFFGGDGMREIPGAESGSDRVLVPEILAPLANLRPSRSDKRHFGHVFVIGGSRSYPGAVLMNVLGALHSGVGLVTAFVPERLAAAYAARTPEAIWVGWPETPAGGLAMEGRHLLDERIERADALAIGSGMSREPEAMALVKAVVASVKAPILIDGDGLQPETLGMAKGPVLLTPHAGEFKRLAGGSDLRRFCAQTGATVVLKGPISQVCDRGRPDDRAVHAESLPVYYSLFGGPTLARGGSGDVLAGLAAGQMALLEAAKVGSGAKESAWPSRLLAASRAVVWHGLAADALARARGQTSVTVTELIGFLPIVLRELARRGGVREP